MALGSRLLGVDSSGIGAGLGAGSLLWIQESSWFLTLEVLSYFPTSSAIHCDMFLDLILHFRSSGPGRFPWTYCPDCLQSRPCVFILHLFFLYFLQCLCGWESWL